jgi:hypothetical protein
MKLRRLTPSGVHEFAAYLTQLAIIPTLDPPTRLLVDTSSSEAVDGDQDLEERSFSSRFEAASYLDTKIAEAGIQNWERDAGLWSWMALFYFDQVCPKDHSGARAVKEQARYIPQIDVSRRYYRHMLLGPVSMYRAHADHPDRLLALLSNPMHVATAETYRLFIENPSLIACKAIVEVATALYYDPKQGNVRRGAGSKDAGGCRRLIDFLQQIDCTFDLPELTKDRLTQMLPAEFRRFIPA